MNLAQSASHVVRVLQRELAYSPVFVSFILLLFLFARVCSQNRQIRKQTRESVPAFVYQNRQIRKQSRASVPAFVYQNRQIRKQTRASVPAFVSIFAKKGNKRGVRNRQSEEWWGK